MSKVSFHGISSNLFANSPDESLLCGFCLDVLNNPHQCPNGHCFCQDCLSGYLNVYQCCPICKVSTPTIQQYSMNTEVRTTIESLPSKCCIESKTVNKCTWIGPLHERQGHVDNDCLYRETCCPHNGCTAKVLKLELQKHVNKCAKRMVSCKHCSQSIRFEAYKVHEKSCVIRKKENHHLHKEQSYSYGFIGLASLCLLTLLFFLWCYSIEPEKKPVPRLRSCTRKYSGIATGKFEGMCNSDGDIVEGILVASDGRGTYEGQYTNVGRHGYGASTDLKGNVHRGEYVNNQAHGHGTYTTDEYTYEGPFVHDRSMGIGVIRYVDGITYRGYVVDSQRHGYGVLSISDDVQIEGEFFENVLVDGSGFDQCMNNTIRKNYYEFL